MNDMKIYGKLIEKYSKCTKGALVDRVLEIYEMKTGLKAVLWNSGMTGWKSEPHKPITIKKYPFNKDGLTCVGIATEFGFIN